MSTTVKVKFEGVVGLLLEKDEDGQVNAVRVLLPNGGEPRSSTKPGAHVIPAHHGYVSYDPRRAAQSSELPDMILPSGKAQRAFNFLRGVVVVLTGQSGTSLTFDPAERDAVVEMKHIAPDAGMTKPRASNGRQSDPEIVSAVMTLGNGTLTAEVDTTRTWKYRRQEVSVATELTLEYEIEESELTIDLQPMDGSTQGNRKIVLDADGETVELAIGNEPIEELLGIPGPMSHRHFEIYYELSQNPPQGEKPVLEPAHPQGRSAEEGQGREHIRVMRFCGPPVIFEG